MTAAPHTFGPEHRGRIAALGTAVQLLGVLTLLLGLASLLRDTFPHAQRLPALLARWSAAPATLSADALAALNDLLTPRALLSLLFQGVTGFVIGVGVALRRAGRAFRRLAAHERPDVPRVADGLAGLGRVFATLAGFMVTAFIAVGLVLLLSPASLSAGLLARILQ